MACEYYVNGDWVTEDQLKEILNNGLLDNLIASDKIQISGFKLDPDKLLKTTKEVIERKNVPARKLADILANEVKTRAGYPLNMLSALELNIVKNPDGSVNEELTDFKIPLWASPYAQKFENLLTSIISKKVVKTKAPGNSYVLGSQEGFKIKEGDEAAGSLADSGIVFTDSFDPKVGLQPMRHDPATGQILPDQIMIPFKFRDEQGKILNLKDFTVEGPDGRIMLDNNKIPAKLLKLMGYRIPTGGRNQMATIEIVGFLPEASGDLVLAPRDFTKRMGSDFDVDKLYTYNYNHFYDSESGQIKMNFLSDQKKIDAAIEVQKDKINALKNELKISKKEAKILDDYIKNQLIGPQEEEEFEENRRIEEEAMEILNAAMSSDAGIKLRHAFDILSVLKRSYKASRENNIQDIRLQILESTTPEILASNLGLDSYGEFESLAPEVDKIRRSRGLVPGITTILSDVYQRNKYINATAGKDGVGSFSLDSTFNIAVQGKELTLLNLSEEAESSLFGSFEEPRQPTAAEILEANTPLAIFGNSISKGDISDKYTLRSQAIIKAAAAQNRPLTDAEKDSLKLKSTIIKSLQSTSVDNEKFQILDKLNINTNTFDAIRALTMLGFEEEDIAGLLTQEIIWEFVDKLVNAQSSLVAYNPNAEADIFTELLKKYDPEGKFLGLDEDKQLEWGSASGEELLKDLESQSLKPLKEGDITPDFNLKQVAILSKFIRLTAIGGQIKQLQSTVNTGSKGLPKSILEVQAKAKQINELEKSPIFNASRLLGTYSRAGLETPTTINGFASYYGTLFGNTVYNKFFPYNTNGFAAIAEEIFMHIPNATDKSLNKQTEMRRDIFEGMRSFLYANTQSNLFGEDPDAERRRLFIDVVEGPYKNMSLAKILSTLSTQSWFQKNGFLNKLDFDLNTNGSISRVNFEAAAAENLDERNIYSGFLYLLDKNFPVGKFNGVEYTSRTLAQELVAAAFLEGGNQGAKQYLKYVPTSYLKTLGFGDYLGNVTFDFQGEFYGNVNDNGIIYTAPSRFARQYFQNNPDKVKTVTLPQLEGQQTVIPETFVLNEAALANNFKEVPDSLTGEPVMEQIRFLSIYDSKLPGKYALYEFDSANRIYRRIPVLLGSYGFVQYNSDSNMPTPTETANRIPTVKPDIVPPGYSVPGAPVQPTQGFNVNVVNNPTSTLMAKDLVIAKDLNNTKAALDDLINVLQDAEGISSLNHLLLDQLRGLKLPEDFTVSYIRDNYQRSGSYDSITHVLEINLNTINLITSDRLATIVAHELIHAHTAEAIYAYLNGELDKLTPKQIEIIKNLESLQQQYIKYLEDIGSTEELKKFTESYRNFKAGKAKSVEGDISKLYGAMKLSEFVTMALTDKGFQNHLNNIIDAKGVSLWEKIKQLFSELLQALGMDIPAGSALASAIKETMDLISATQEAMPEGSTLESFKYYGGYYDIKIVDGVPVDVVNLKKNAAETTVRFEERKNKILAAFKQDPTTDPQNARKPITPTGVVTEAVPTTQTNAPASDLSIKTVSEPYGVVTTETNPSKEKTQQFVNLIQPQIQKQAYQENRTGNKMFMYGLRWTRKNTARKPLNNRSYANKGLPLTDAKATDGYAYDTVDQNGNPLAPLTDLQPIINEIQNSLGIDMSGYDAVIGNIYLPGQRIQTHRDTTESLSARNYPVVVYTIGAGNAINIYENEKNPGLASFASDKKIAIPTKNGTIYTFGMDGKGRFELGHDTPYAIKKEDVLPPITMPDGTIIKDYTITLTFRRAGDLTPGMPISPAKIEKTTQQSSAPVSPEPNKITPQQQAAIDVLAENGITLHYMDGTYDVMNSEEGIIAEYRSLEEAIIIGLQTISETRKAKETAPPPVVEEKKTPISNEVTINNININTGDITVNPQQLKALQNVANFIDSVIKGNVTDVDISYTLAGYAGTGKTTITKFILQYLHKKGKNYVISSPTHRAKEVLSDATGEKARTLAQVLGLAAGVDLEGFNLQDKIFVAKNKDKVPSAGILVIDEASMINDALYREVIQLASKKGTKVLFIGDDGQLKPVKQIQKSQPFRRMTNISKLTQVMRTADGNPMPAEVLQPIRDNPLSKVDMFDHTTKLSDKGEGIEFTNSPDNWTKEMLAEFTMENFDKNPNHARALAYTNARVRDLNQMIRTNMFGFGAEPFYEGELLMMYENLFYNMGTQDYDFSNGADVKVVGVEYTDQHVITSPTKERFTVKGYKVKLVDAKTGRPKENDLFIADMNLVDKGYLHELAKLKTIAINAPKNQTAEAWKNYYQFSSSYNLMDDVYEIEGYILPADEALKVLKDKSPLATKKDLGRFKAKDKSVDYAYAHTIHKSQGGTYSYAFVDENNIDIARNFSNPDYELINQLKYVGFSRSSKKTVVLSGKTGTAAAPVVPRQKLDMSGLSDPTKYTTPPSATDFESQQEEYKPEPGADQSLEDSVINRDDYENYLLICGK
jgi:exodeoxyribonuclease-5